MQFGPGFLPTFLYYFVSTAVIVTLVAVKGMGMGVDTGIPQQFGILGGLVAGVLGTYINQTTTFSVQFKNKKKFLEELETALNQMGYEQTSEEDGIRVYERSTFRRAFAGKVYVQLEGNSVTIASRAANIRRLRQAVG